MSEVVNVIVALAVIVFVVRWATSSTRETPEERNVRNALGFRPKAVTSQMSETISSMFPDMPRENIHYDLLRTGSVEMTTNKIIERGYLDPPPPAYFRIYPLTVNQQQQPGTAQRPTSRTSTPSNTNNINAPTPQASSASSSSSSSSTFRSKSAPSLIAKYRLENRLSSQSGDGESSVFDSPEQAGGKSAWEATPESREASLRERKAQMVLAARKRLLEQKKAAEAEAGPSGHKTE